MLYFGAVLFTIYLIFRFIYIFFPLRGEKFRKMEKIRYNKSFAILVPAYNEERIITSCVASLIHLHYPRYKAYIINDGSKDKTFDVLDRFLYLKRTKLDEDPRLSYNKIISKHVSTKYPNIFVINKENGGKADALNAGISCCREEVVITLDADCILQKNAVKIMNQAFQNNRVIAAGGTVHIIQNIAKPFENSKMNNTVKYQVLQYLIAFYMHKFTQSIFSAMIVISGAFGAFKRSLLLELNGYRKTVGEDMDITLKIHRYIKLCGNIYKMAYVPDSVCYTECPETLAGLFRQRIRWQKAFIDCLIHYGARMFSQFNLGISVFLIFDSFLLVTCTTALFLLTPVYIVLGNGISVVFIIVVLVDFILGIIDGFLSIRLTEQHRFYFSKKEKLRMYLFIPFQLISYRYINIFFILAGTAGYFFGKHHWNKVDRKGQYVYPGPGICITE